MNLGEVILLYRRRQGLTLREVEERTGVSAATISRIENGHDCYFSCALALMQGLCIPAHQLAQCTDHIKGKS